jgi:hypothetical protein
MKKMNEQDNKHFSQAMRLIKEEDIFWDGQWVECYHCGLDGWPYRQGFAKLVEKHCTRTAEECQCKRHAQKHSGI